MSAQHTHEDAIKALRASNKHLLEWLSEFHWLEIQLHTRIDDLESQLYAVGAGGVGQPMLAAAPQPDHTQHLDATKDGWPTLDKPARVGGGTFGIGTSSRHVVSAAQRAHEEHLRVGALTHEQMVEEERSRRKLWDMIHGPVDAAPQPPERVTKEMWENAALLALELASVRVPPEVEQEL